MSTAATATRKSRRTKPLAERFEAYHRAHPGVYVAFKRKVRRMRWDGHKRISAQYICDWLSFETQLDMRPDEHYKVDHSFGPFYARMVIAEDHTFAHYFEMRPSVADTVDVAALVKVA